MEFSEARKRVKRDIPCTDYLTKSKNGLYVCPWCNSGNGPKGTGALEYFSDTNKVYCNGNCKLDKQPVKDVIDLYQKVNGVTDHVAAVRELASLIGIEVDQPSGRADRHDRQPVKSKPQLERDPEPEQEPKTERRPAEKAEPQEDLTAYFEKCQTALFDEADGRGLEYMRSRHIADSITKTCGIGYDPEADPAKSGHTCPRVIIPTTKYHYVGRSVSPHTAKAFAKMNNKGSTPGIFDPWELLETAEAEDSIFIVEGAFDAMAIMSQGSNAVGLNSTGNIEKILLPKLEKHPTKATLIVCLDNDKAGKDGTEVLLKGLRRLNIKYTTADICGKHNDPNDAWIADEESFCDMVDRAKIMAAIRPNNTSLYIDQLMAGEIEEFNKLSGLKTGYASLDAEDKAGGLNPGLYIIAAATSMGKTTFTHQMADQIAASGQDVLYFSLEQSRLELVAKSLTRTMAKNYCKAKGSRPVSSQRIRKGGLTESVREAAREYKRYVGEHMSIIEGNFRCDIPFIREQIEEHHRKTGVYPVVVIDYLQILQPSQAGNRHQATKEIVEECVKEMKQMSRNLQIPVFAISSVNREYYTKPISFEALKETGCIEFTADVVWGLQFRVLGEDDKFASSGKDAPSASARWKEIKEEENREPRKVQLVCLKNRFGKKNFTCDFDYYPKWDYFDDDPKEVKATADLKARFAGLQ